jgi:ATP-binding cassette subfamily C (CFTR/MRP) protein 1
MVIFWILTLILGFCYNFSTIWFGFWSKYQTAHPFDRSKYGYYIGICSLLQILGVTSLTLAFYVFSITIVKRTGKLLHLRAITIVMGAPLSLFTTTPPGVILNRFSNDLTIMDGELASSLSIVCTTIVMGLGQAAVIATASPYVLVS